MLASCPSPPGLLTGGGMTPLSFNAPSATSLKGDKYVRTARKGFPECPGYLARPGRIGPGVVILVSFANQRGQGQPGGGRGVPTGWTSLVGLETSLLHSAWRQGWASGYVGSVCVPPAPEPSWGPGWAPRMPSAGSEWVLPGRLGPPTSAGPNSLPGDCNLGEQRVRAVSYARVQRAFGAKRQHFVI